ncbi:MAG: glycine dehydrogenase (aminomethyl-transferring) [SAR116 cluster bacterium]|nr:MAG: glycine dehydrogenase (aminomethyl-transferring) [SAR116 cluster bacterium]|tara:strand:- start:2270 stop:5125 length:2856 start_codon:yes stop_codon:yes gene_type:complete
MSPLDNTHSIPTAAPQAPFASRHIGLNAQDVSTMLTKLGTPSLEALLDEVIPAKILRASPMEIPQALSEAEVLADLAALASQNSARTSLIGMGYYGCHTPPVIQRNVLENPAWYTAYTPYQPEISQGRLEAILNFQTMVTDLTGMDIANGSLLDEATAAAEAMAMAFKAHRGKGNIFRVDPDAHPQTINVLKTRAAPIGITLEIAAVGTPFEADCFGALISYPGSTGEVRDIKPDIDDIQAAGGMAIVASDLLALCVLESPGSLGADIVLGSAQRFGVPFGYGGPHAAFFATKTAHQRSIPGRLVGVSQDAQGKQAYRLALQTREQHIRREKATSNICTAQVLLAVMAGFYAVWHGPEGLTRIANHAHDMACRFAAAMRRAGHVVRHEAFFDTVAIEAADDQDTLMAAALKAGFNLRPLEGALAASFDETTTSAQLKSLLAALNAPMPTSEDVVSSLPQSTLRTTSFLRQPVFHKYRSETEMMRYMRSLADRDLALDRCMIPLGSCTMKLNATAEMMPVTWPEFANIHPYAPDDQAAGYLEMIDRLEKLLATATGYAAVSLQPNAGSQGEFAGLLAIARYLAANGEGHRNICLIPSSAHGTNPASAAMAGMKVVVVKCDDDGNVDMSDLQAKTDQHRDNLAAIMVTYPSTHGVFEESIAELCEMVHEAGGQVYVDGANLNALVGHCAPPQFGADVSHLNLHKTFCIPHGGGGPGIGPIGVAAHLAPYLPGSPLNGDNAVSAAPFGSASILPITYAYIRMMGPDGLTNATSMAILSANYIAARLGDVFPVLYTGSKGRVAHECIVDVRGVQDRTGISNEDIAKRLIDFGFHAPTMSFPVAGTLMIEPTESESLVEIDRFCDAMLAIAAEIEQVANGIWPADDNPLVNAPHTSDEILADNWTHPYSRKQAASPKGNAQANKYWPPVGRVDNAYGDRNLICSCPSIEEWEQAAE